MKKTFLLLISGLTIWISGYCQTDTISENIYQKNGNIGIGINDPGFLLQIEGNESSGIERNILKLHNNTNGTMAYTGMILQTGSDVGSSVIQDYSSLYTASPAYDFAGFLNIGNSNNGIMFHARKQGIIKFYTGFDETAGGGIERLRIDSAGNVGINTDSPQVKLEVNGGIKLGNSTQEFAGTMRWTGSDFEGYTGSDWLSLSSTNNSLWNQNGNGLIFNLGNIGIGSESNNHLLEIESNISTGIERNFIKLKNNSESISAYTGILLETGESGGNSVIQSYGINYTASSPYDFGGFLNISNNSKGINYIANSEDAIHRFYTKGTNNTLEEKARIDSAGNLGLGTTNPVAKFQVADGDIYISDIEKGIIMKSPDGNCWRGTLDNSGQLVFTSIDCPDIESVINIQQLKSSGNIKVYPNPSNTLINIDLSNFEDKELEYKIYKFSGQIQNSGKIKSDIQTINISNLTSGAYILSIYDKKGEKIVSQKIIKER